MNFDVKEKKYNDMCYRYEYENVNMKTNVTFLTIDWYWMFKLTPKSISPATLKNIMLSSLKFSDSDRVASKTEISEWQGKLLFVFVFVCSLERLHIKPRFQLYDCRRSTFFSKG